MKPQATTLLLAAPLLAIGTTSSAPPTTELDLTPRFEAGQNLTIEQSFTMDLALDQLSVIVDGAEVLGDGIGMDMEMEGTVAYSEEIVEVRDGQIAKMLLTVDEQSGELTGEVDAMGQAETIDEPIDSEIVGHTIEIVVDEEGELTRTDVTEEASGDLSEAELMQVTQRNHFEELLPTEPVEEGAEFELAADWMDRARELMEAEMNSGEMAELGGDEIEAVRMVMDAFFDGTSVEATGKVTEVSDGIATIEYDLSAIMSIDDLVSIVAQALPPEAGGEIPPGVEAALEANVEMTGSGQFDLGIGQMVSLELEGEYEVIFSGAADMGGQSAEADATMSGTLALTATVSVE